MTTTTGKRHLAAFAATWAASFTTPEARIAYTAAKRAGAATTAALAAAEAAEARATA